MSYFQKIINRLTGYSREFTFLGITMIAAFQVVQHEKAKRQKCDMEKKRSLRSL